MGFTQNLKQSRLIGLMKCSESEPPLVFSKFPENRLLYDAKMTSKHVYCDVRINGFSVLDNVGSVKGIAQANFGIVEILKNGANEIAIEVDSWNWIDDSTVGLSDKDRANYTDPVAFCELELNVSFLVNDELQKKTVAILKASLNKELQLMIAPESKNFDLVSSPANTLSMEKIARPGYRAKNIYRIKRILNADHLPNWLWVKAPKYQDIPNNRALLEEAYLEIWQAFNNKDEKELKSLLAIVIEELAMGNLMTDDIDDETRQDFFEQLGYQERFEKGFKILPFDLKDFILETFAEGRIVRLAIPKHKSPIRYTELDDDIEIYANHYFAFINGKFRAEVNKILYEDSYLYHKQALNLLCEYLINTTTSERYLLTYYPSIARDIDLGV